MAIARTQPDSPNTSDLASYCRRIAESARHASSQLLELSTAVKNAWLELSAERLKDSAQEILSCNARDLEQAPQYGLSDAAIDRLRLTPSRIDQICQTLRQVAGLPDPVGEIIGGSTRPNGLQIQKVRVPIGVLLFIYESRPNVTIDAAAIAIKSGNAILLRGGKEAFHSSRGLVELLRETGREVGLPEDAIQMVETLDREAVGLLLHMSDCIDLVIPRGGESLVRRVVAEAKMPVLKHYDGNCHVYIDSHADLNMAERIVINSKTQRMGVCNAAESLLVHADVASRLLPALGSALQQRGVELRGDAKSCELLPMAKPASDSDWGAEYLGPILSVRVVASLEEAIEHIQRYGSHHTDAIVTNDLANARRFAQRVDSAAVMINASTRFNDGGELGLGAEIGISTDKLHARGPCGLQELTTYKYIVTGDGHVRE